MQLNSGFISESKFTFNPILNSVYPFVQKFKENVRYAWLKGIGVGKVKSEKGYKKLKMERMFV